MLSTLSFSEGDLNFDIEYDEKSNFCRLMVAHAKKMIYWSTIVTESLDTLSSGSINIEVSPRTLYDIFVDYHNKCLPDTVIVLLPLESSLRGDVQLDITITMKLKFGGLFDTKLLSLNPVSMTNEKRSELKLSQMNDEITILAKRIEFLEEKYTKLAAIVESSGCDLFRVNKERNKERREDGRYCLLAD